jgi:hypothetical protein
VVRNGISVADYECKKCGKSKKESNCSAEDERFFSPSLTNRANCSYLGTVFAQPMQSASLFVGVVDLKNRWRTLFAEF